MTSTRAPVAVAWALLSGCGGGGGEGLGPQGVWAVELTSGCVWSVALEGDAYETNLGCALAAGGFGLDAELGIYDLTDDTITFTAERASCADTSTDPTVAKFDVLPDGGLRLSTSRDVLELDRVERSEVTEEGATVGCFLDDGSFEESPLAVL